MIGSVRTVEVFPVHERRKHHELHPAPGASLINGYPGRRRHDCRRSGLLHPAPIELIHHATSGQKCCDRSGEVPLTLEDYGNTGGPFVSR